MKADVIIIGSGIAGLNTALQLSKGSPELKVIVLSKSGIDDTNSQLAQGGVAVSTKLQKEQKKHIEDTMIAGNYQSNPEVVNEIIRASSAIADHLIRLGVPLDRDEKGGVDLIKEGGHSASRIIHSRDTTGAAIMHALIEHLKTQPNVTLLPDHFSIDLLVSEKTSTKHKCRGVLAMDNASGERFSLYSAVTILATGGIGVIYGKTTNSPVSTGDGIAMAFRAGAKVTDLEFVQFHPTVYFDKKAGSSFLISEAVRGAGAFLKNTRGVRFMSKYDQRLELASRDIVARAILAEMTLYNSDHVYLDCTHLSTKQFRMRFPSIYQFCINQGLNPKTDFIPVAPAQHYICGGISTDLNGQTTIENLFACGECTRTGLHGANRLASNSLLEALVMSARIASHIINSPLPKIKEQLIPDRDIAKPSILSAKERLKDLRHEMQCVMQREVSIIRTNYGLAMAMEKLSEIEEELSETVNNIAPDIETLELVNMILVAKLIVKQCLERTENKGGHFNLNLLTHYDLSGQN